MRSAALGIPWTISGEFDSDVSVDIVTDGGWSFAELHPFCGDWTQDEIKRVHIVRAAPAMLDALKAIRKIGYDTSGTEKRLREAMLTIINLAENAVGFAESTSTRDSAGDPAGGTKK